MQYRLRSGRGSDARARAGGASKGEPRLRIAKGFLTAWAIIVIVRLFMLQVVDARFYRNLASEQRDTYRELFPERGEILMHDGQRGMLTPLATNKDLYLIYADPRLIENPKIVAEKLAPLLGIEMGANGELGANLRISNSEIRKFETNSELAPLKKDEYQEFVNRLSKKDDPYEPLQRGIEEAVVLEIKKLKLLGIDMVREPVRYYPFKNISAHVAGFFGSSGEAMSGRYGIEGAYDSELAGEQGFFDGENDIAGRWIPVGRRELKQAVDGSTVVLTIDRVIQYTACSKLNEAVLRHGASGGSVVIMEVATGKILAMCGAPDFDPNEYSKVEDISVYNNPATFEQYEPGSVFKVITMAAALDTGQVTPEMTYEDTGEVKIGPHTIRNSDSKKHGIQTMTQVLEQSFNTGAIFAARKVGVKQFRDYVERFGFGTATGVGLRSEAKGDISSLLGRGEIYLATASFGQGISVSPMQMVASFSAIANQGKLMKPYIIDEIRKSNGAVLKTAPTVLREVVSPRTATLLSGMLASVVERGHGKRAGVPGYYVGGKTGTAQIPRKDGKGYEQSEAIGTFVGFAPIENPKFAMLTRIDRPKDVQFAESSAAPLFGEIAKFLLQYYEVKPTRTIK